MFDALTREENAKFSSLPFLCFGIDVGKSNRSQKRTGRAENESAANERGIEETVGEVKPFSTYQYEDNLPYGHGEKSNYLIEHFIRLTFPEVLAIRHHMGKRGLKESQKLFDAAARICPEVTFLYNANSMAKNLMEKTE